MAVVTPGSTGVGGIGSDFATIATSVASGPIAGLKTVPETSTRTTAALVCPPFGPTQKSGPRLPEGTAARTK
jgi:hypothetical protein